MISWQPFCRIQKRFCAINVNSEYCVKCVKFLFSLSFIHYNDIFFYDLKTSDVKKTSIITSNSVFPIPHFNGFHNVYAFFE